MAFASLPSENNAWTQDPDNPHHSFRYIQEYTPPGVIKRVGAGSSSVVGLLKDGTVLKYPPVKVEGMESLAVEKAIYDALSDHERIARCLGITEGGLKLEFASQGSVTYHLGKNPAPSAALRLRWCRQAAEAVAFLHTKGAMESARYFLPQEATSHQKKDWKLHKQTCTPKLSTAPYAGQLH